MYRLLFIHLKLLKPKMNLLIKGYSSIFFPTCMPGWSYHIEVFQPVSLESLISYVLACDAKVRPE